MPSPQGIATRRGSQPWLTFDVVAGTVPAGNSAPASPLPTEASVVPEAALVNDHGEGVATGGTEKAAAASEVGEAAVVDDVVEAALAMLISGITSEVAEDGADDISTAEFDVVADVASGPSPSISIVDVTVMVRAVAVALTVMVCVVCRLEVVRSVYMIGYTVSVFA